MFFSFPLSGWLWKHHGMMRPANDWWIPVIFEISYTDWCVCDARSRLNMRSLTRIHLCRMHSSWSHASWTGVLSILTASANFAHFNSYLETLSVTSLHSSFVHLFCKKQLTERNCTIKLFFVFFKQIQILIRILYYLLNSNQHITNTAGMCENMSFLLPWKTARGWEIMHAFRSWDYQDIACQKPW